MEELFAYALLVCSGYDLLGAYSKKLDELFLERPDDEELLHLEQLTAKEAVLHTISRMSGALFDTESFGRALMEEIGTLYARSDLAEFSKRMYSLWKLFPATIQDEEPFWTFSYADECLCYGDEGQCRRSYESAIHHYDR